MDENLKMYLGLEINLNYVMISSFSAGMNEPETISRITGSEAYQIPLCLLKKHGVGQWFYGEEAKNLRRDGGGVYVDDLYGKSLSGERIEIEGENYEAEDLFALFLRKVFLLPRKLGSNMEIGKAVVTVDKLELEEARLLETVLGKAGLLPEQFLMVDNRESFYYYALSQKPEQYLHDVALFDCMEDELRFFCLSRNMKTVPQMISIEEKNFGVLYGDKDAMFEEYIETAFAHRIISTTYLIGNGFEGDWMKNSARELCRGRKAFLGRNLYSKGACYAAMVRGGVMPWNYIYMGDNELKINVSLKVRLRGEMAFYSLLTAGESWYESFGECEIILDGKPEIDFWLQEPNSREARIQTMELTDFPERENKTTRLRITAKPVSDTAIHVKIKDLGFGEIVRASDKVWEYTMNSR